MKKRFTAIETASRREPERNPPFRHHAVAAVRRRGPQPESRFTLLQLLTHYRVGLLLVVVIGSALLGGGCFETVNGEQFYGKVVVPQGQEFRWSNGGLPQIFDPARAAAPPDTDAVRALFEGLTDYDPVTLKPVPAIAGRWESADGGARWTFYLRKDAYWSNGDPVTALDFVRSWKRTLRLREQAPHARLLANIRGAKEFADSAIVNSLSSTTTQATAATPGLSPNVNAPALQFGVEATDTHTLNVTLLRPDRNFPALVAHPVFRPFHELSPGGDASSAERAGQSTEAEDLKTSIVTNGPFRLSGLGSDGVVLERAKNYWDASSVGLERVRFVPSGSAEEALTAYKAGELDAVTNAAFEPLALKLLAPYKDFRRSTFGALTYYRFNTSRAPFDDRRVREALAVALDLERLSADTMGGATEPAKKFLPSHEGDMEDTAPAVEKGAKGDAGAGEAASAEEPQEAEPIAPLESNPERARRLLAEAGFPGGRDFPVIRLLVNRSEQQRLMALAVARMWRSTLGVQTEVVIRNWEEYEALLKAGEYDVARRSVVLQTMDEETNMLALFGEQEKATIQATDGEGAPIVNSSPTPTQHGAATTIEPQSGMPQALPPILTESQALRELPAIPVYFASSYALVKPYVGGFDSNLLDAPSLKHVTVNGNWKPPAPREAVSITWGEGR